mmetsp:Transcript_33946/g.101048  ORF Transcript_33946/g.101048 Transcript_33946/m.101048 type:complete len:86 (-) Transcript_33946:346-603(-)
MPARSPVQASSAAWCFVELVPAGRGARLDRPLRLTLRVSVLGTTFGLAPAESSSSGRTDIMHGGRAETGPRPGGGSAGRMRRPGV